MDRPLLTNESDVARQGGLARPGEIRGRKLLLGLTLLKIRFDFL